MISQIIDAQWWLVYHIRILNPIGTTGDFLSHWKNCLFVSINNWVSHSYNFFEKKNYPVCFFSQNLPKRCNLLFETSGQCDNINFDTYNRKASIELTHSRCGKSSGNTTIFQRKNFNPYTHNISRKKSIYKLFRRKSLDGWR